VTKCPKAKDDCETWVTYCRPYVW